MATTSVLSNPWHTRAHEVPGSGDVAVHAAVRAGESRTRALCAWKGRQRLPQRDRT